MLEHMEVLPWQAVSLDPMDFTEINHANAGLGRPKLTRQMAQMIWNERHAE